MKRTKVVGGLLAIVLGVTLLFVASATAQNMTWIPATTWTSTTGATGTFTAEEMATMTFYLRARKRGDTADRKYFGETRNGVATWSGDFSTIFQQRGLGTPVQGEVWEVSVSQAFMNPNGQESDSPELVGMYTFPFGPDQVPVVPSGLVITE